MKEKDMDLTEKTVGKNYIYRGKILNLRCDDAQFPDGRLCKREFVEHLGGAGIIAVLGGKIALVRQFRYAYGEVLLEIPAGKLEEGEAPANAAERELAEETGLIAGRLELLFTVYPTPGYSNEKIYIYEAEDIRRGEAHPDEGEFLDVVYVPLSEAFAMTEDGRIKDAKTIIALQALQAKVK